MNNFLRSLARLTALAVLGTAVITAPAVAQDKGKEAKAAPAAPKKGEAKLEEILNNDQVRVVKATFGPGEAAANAPRPLRVVHVIKGGTLTLMYPDGKKESLALKTGDTLVRQPSPQYMPKNEGKSDVVLLVVNVKEPKK